MLEKLLPSFEHRSFRYDFDGDVIQARNCMLALWLYLLTNFDHISVLHYQDLAYSMGKA